MRGKLNKNGCVPEQFIVAVAVICIAAHFLLYAYLNFAGLPRYCNSDVFADMQLAKRMWEKKTLFPTGWGFCNQYFVIGTPVLAALFYGVLGNINIAMAMATEVMSALIMLSFLWLLRGCEEPLSYRLLGCVLLLFSVVLPYGSYAMNSMLFFTQASFYSCYLITMFVVFGDYIRVRNDSSIRVPAWVLSVLLCFATGMHSLRQTAVMVLPLFAYELFCGLRHVCVGSPFWTKADRPRLMRVLSYGLANGVGILLMKWLDVPISPIYSSNQGTSVAERLQGKLIAIGTALAEITSVDYLLAGDCSKLLLVVIVLILAVAVGGTFLWFSRIRRPESGTEACWALCAIGLCAILLATVVTDVTLRGIYLFMWFPLVAFSGLMLVKRLPEWGRKLATVLVCVLSLMSLLYCFAPNLRETATGEETDAQRMSDWAVENGYQYVYGEYWGTAPQVAVWADGKLDAGCWHGEQNVYLVEMANTPKDIYGEDENQKAVYVFTAVDEAQGLERAEARGVTLTKVAEFGVFCAYTSPVQLMQEQ